MRADEGRRVDALPGVPPVSEVLPGYEASSWTGIGAPARTPPAIIEQLNGEINAGLANAKLRAQLVDLGAAVLTGSPAGFRDFIAVETEKWRKVVRSTGIKPE